MAEHDIYFFVEEIKHKPVFISRVAVVRDSTSYRIITSINAFRRAMMIRGSKPKAGRVVTTYFERDFNFLRDQAWTDLAELEIKEYDTLWFFYDDIGWDYKRKLFV